MVLEGKKLLSGKDRMPYFVNIGNTKPYISVAEQKVKKLKLLLWLQNSPPFCPLIFS